MNTKHSQPSHIVCCSPDFGEDWKWVAPRLDLSCELDWDFVAMKPSRLGQFARWRCAWQAVQAVRKQGAELLVTHQPWATFRCAWLCRKLGIKVRHLAYSFHFESLDISSYKLKQMREVFQDVDRFVVYSTLEQQSYHDTFGIPRDRLEMVHWGVNEPEHCAHAPALEQGPYVCAIGGSGRDYHTLIEAMRLLPDIPLVAVVRPHSLQGIDIPPNVRVKVNIPLSDVVNILQHSQFMALPLKGHSPCGPGTLVMSMYLKKGLIVSDSQGIADYIQDGHNGLTSPLFDVPAFAAKIRALWENPEQARSLGENGRRFALENCTEERIVAQLENYLKGALA